MAGAFHYVSIRHSFESWAWQVEPMLQVALQPRALTGPRGHSTCK